MSWPFEDDAAVGHVVTRKAHQRHHQGGFARSVGSEEDMGLSGRNFHIDVFEDRSSTDLHGQRFDGQHGSPSRNAGRGVGLRFPFSSFEFPVPSFAFQNRPERSISRILFPGPVTRRRGNDHSSDGRRLPAASGDLPGSTGGPPADAPLFGLAPGGVYQASPVTRGTGALLPHRFTLACDVPPGGGNRPSAVCSLLHFPSRRRASRLWSTLPCGVRTFLRDLKDPGDRLSRSDRS